MRYQLSIRTLIACFIAFGNVVCGAELYVSPNGNDSHPGTKNQPFRSITRARDAARHQITSGLTRPLTVYLREGRYELGTPLTFGPEDSGTADAPVMYASMPGESVTLSGGRRITGWKKGPDGTWTVHLPDVHKGRWFFRQLTVDGQRATRARWPNRDGDLRIESTSDDVTKFTFNKPLPEGIQAGDEAELVVYQDWSVTRGRIREIEKQLVTTETAMGWIGHSWTTASRGKSAIIEHGRHLIDEPGEWFLDRLTGVLTYHAVDGKDPNQALVVAPVLEQVVRITGTSARPVRHLHFKGLRMEDSHFPLPSIGYNELQAAHYGSVYEQEDFHVQPVAIECVHAAGIRFDRCRFAHFGASGIGFGPGCRNNTVSGCALDDIGGNGVMIGWRGVGKLNPGRKALHADWSDAAMAPTGNQVTGCDIRRCGAESRGAVGIFVGFSADTRIARNHVHDLPYTGISIGYNWSTESTSMARCVVEHNHIHDVMKLLADGGGIYTLGYQPGTVLKGNHIHDVHRSSFAHGGAENNGIFFDQGSKGFRVEDNVIYATSGKATRFHQSKQDWHVWSNNFLGEKNPPTDAKAREIIRQAGP